MITKSPYPDVTIPHTAFTPFVLQRAATLGDKPALIEGPTGRIITYAQLKEKINRVASSLAQRGFGKGHVFGILSPNLPEYAIAFHAVASLGGIATLINPLYTESEIGHQLKDAGARFLVTVPGFLEKAS
ncbi:MAG TPA: AMP-binding protein, partial [Candidatus Angelobacter sp.]|nr:AMP-binding protein [Candidatus Angelobacter sp.]